MSTAELVYCIILDNFDYSLQSTLSLSILLSITC